LPPLSPGSSGLTLASQYGPKNAIPQAMVAVNRIRFPVTREQRAITAVQCWTFVFRPLDAYVAVKTYTNIVFCDFVTQIELVT